MEIFARKIVLKNCTIADHWDINITSESEEPTGLLAFRRPWRALGMFWQAPSEAAERAGSVAYTCASHGVPLCSVLYLHFLAVYGTDSEIHPPHT